MYEGIERRKYHRIDSIVYKAVLSLDGINWESFHISDISAEGLRFVSDRSIDSGSKLFFNICIYNMLSEFDLKLQGHIVREEAGKDLYSYSAKFDDIDKYTWVQLDELIKSKISLTGSEQNSSDDGTYTFMLIPRTRSKRPSLHL